ncbi:MAG TPA: 4-(cytidine 5'-diphospho)-2-C-methyl-D-erythritol kinase, partial [Edaphobacter sp.]
MSTRVRSYSKVNLGLAIGPVRPDGFHGLTTVYQTLELHDVVTVSARQASATKIELTTNDARVPVDGRNTCWKMVEQALERMGVAADVSIHIDKRLPVQGGMGAGSANAAAALIGLERELGTTLPGAERLSLAGQVGSDVPLFLLGGAVLGLGRGEMVVPLPDMPSVFCVVAVPEVGVSTPQAFRDWDALQGSAGLTPVDNPDRLNELSLAYASLYAEPGTSGIFQGSGSETSQGSQGDDLAENTLLALVRTGVENDFERVVFPAYPSLREIKR